MVKEYERQGICAAVITALPVIPFAVGTSRVVRGVRVEHVCGNPQLSTEVDQNLCRRIVRTALQAVQTEVDSPTIFEPDELSEEEE